MSRHDDKPKNSFGTPLDPSSDPDFTQLRRQAEQQARALESNGFDAQWPSEARRLVHELRVHQVELEM